MKTYSKVKQVQKDIFMKFENAKWKFWDQHYDILCWPEIGNVDLFCQFFSVQSSVWFQFFFGFVFNLFFLQFDLQTSTDKKTKRKPKNEKKTEPLKKKTKYMFF